MNLFIILFLSLVLSSMTFSKDKVHSIPTEKLIYGFKIVKITPDKVIVELKRELSVKNSRRGAFPFKNFKFPKDFKFGYMTFLESKNVEKLTFEKYVRMSNPLGGRDQYKYLFAQFKRLDKINNTKYNVTVYGAQKAGDPLAVFPFEVKTVKIYNISPGRIVNQKKKYSFIQYKYTPKIHSNLISHKTKPVEMFYGGWRFDEKEKKYLFSRQIIHKDKKQFTHFNYMKKITKHEFDEVVILKESDKNSTKHSSLEYIYINNEFIFENSLLNYSRTKKYKDKKYTSYSIVQKLMAKNRPIYVLKKEPDSVEEFNGYNYHFTYKNDEGKWRRTSLPSKYFYYDFFMDMDGGEYEY